MKFTIELDKAECEIIGRGLRKLRQSAFAADSNISKQQAGILARKCHALESQFEDMIETFGRVEGGKR